MIDQKRNQRLWQACGWKLNNPDAPKYLRLYLDPTGELVPLPTPSDPVPFVGYLLRDALPKVREKYKDSSVELVIYRMLFNRVEQEMVAIRTPDDSIARHADTLSEAMFNAFEKAMGLDKEEK